MNTEILHYNSTAKRNAEIYLLAKKESHESIGEKFNLPRKRVSQICIDEHKRLTKAEKAEQLRSDFHKHNDINLKYPLEDLLLLLSYKPATRARLVYYFRTLGVESLSVKEFADAILLPVLNPERLSDVCPIIYQWGVGITRVVEIIDGILCLVPNGEFKDDFSSRLPVLCEYLEEHKATFPEAHYAHYAKKNLLMNGKSAIPPLSSHYPLSHHAQKNAHECLPVPF